MIERGIEIKDVSVVKEARSVFRKSLATNLTGVMTQDDISKFEQWFIQETINSYNLSKSRRWMERQSIVINYSVLKTVNEMYCDGYLGVVGALESWQEARSGKVLAGLEREIVKANETIRTEPARLEEMRQFNEKLDKVYGESIGLAVRSAAEGAGMLLGNGIILVGLASGGLGFVVGKGVRTAGEAIVKGLTRGKK